MEDPKFKGNEMKAVYKPVTPVEPELLYHESRITGERYNDDGSVWVSPEQKLAEAKALAEQVKKEEAAAKVEAAKPKAKGKDGDD